MQSAIKTAALREAYLWKPSPRQVIDMSTIEKQRGSHHKNTTSALALISSRNSRTTTIQVERTPFNDRALDRDLMQLCESANKDSPRLSDGRQLSFAICSICCILPAQHASRIP